MSKQLVLAFFESEAAADAAATAVKAWDKADDQIKLGAIGVLAKDANGKVKTQKLGKRNTVTGAVLFGIVGLLTGGLSVLGGAVFGGILGFFFHKGLGLSKEDAARIDTALDGGKAAVGIVAPAEQATAISAKLTELGGTVENYEVSDEAVEQVQEAVDAAPEEPEAAADAAPEAAADAAAASDAPAAEETPAA